MIVRELIMNPFHIIEIVARMKKYFDLQTFVRYFQIDRSTYTFRKHITSSQELRVNDENKHAMFMFKRIQCSDQFQCDERVKYLTLRFSINSVPYLPSKCKYLHLIPYIPKDASFLNKCLIVVPNGVHTLIMFDDLKIKLPISLRFLHIIQYQHEIIIDQPLINLYYLKLRYGSIDIPFHLMPNLKVLSIWILNNYVVLPSSIHTLKIFRLNVRINLPENVKFVSIYKDEYNIADTFQNVQIMPYDEI